MTTEHIDTIKGIIKQAKFAMLTTITDEGHLHAQPMTTLQTESFPHEIWFIGSKASECVENIAAREQINLAYDEDGDYVSINGVAKLIDDQAKLQELWEEGFDTFFSQGINDPNIQLICVYANGAEYWQSPSMIKTQYEFAKAAITGDSVDGALGDKDSVEFTDKHTPDA